MDKKPTSCKIEDHGLVTALTVASRRLSDAGVDCIYDLIRAQVEALRKP